VGDLKLEEREFETQTRMNHVQRTQALRLRTKRFAGSIVRFYVDLDKRPAEISILAKQLIRSGTSVGANYREASRSAAMLNLLQKLDYAHKKQTKLNIGSNF